MPCNLCSTTGERLRSYFENYGVVREAFVSYNRVNGRPRGFGFVVFENTEVVDKVVGTRHTIDRREVDVKRAVPKEESSAMTTTEAAATSSLGQDPAASSYPPPPTDASAASSSQGGRSRKLFVGGLASTVDENALRSHFEPFGPIEEVVVMLDHEHKRPRGFGFVTFVSEESIDLVFSRGSIQTLHDKQIEIKSAVPRDQMSPPSNNYYPPQPHAPSISSSSSTRGAASAASAAVTSTIQPLYGYDYSRYAAAAPGVMGVVTPRGGLYASNGGLGYLTTFPGIHNQLPGLPTASLPNNTRGLVIPTASNSQYPEARGGEGKQGLGGRGRGGGGGGYINPNPFQPSAYESTFYPTNVVSSSSSTSLHSSSATPLPPPSSSPSSSAMAVVASSPGSSTGLFNNTGGLNPVQMGNNSNLIPSSSQALAYNLASLQQAHLNGLNLSGVRGGSSSVGGSPSAGKMDSTFSSGLKALNPFPDPGPQTSGGNGVGDNNTNSSAGTIDYASEVAKAAADLNAAAAGLAAAAAEYPSFSATSQWSS